MWPATWYGAWDAWGACGPCRRSALSASRLIMQQSYQPLAPASPHDESCDVRVLIVEDDAELAGLLRDGLREHRIDPTVAATFADGVARAHSGDYDVIILDVRLPGGSGFDLCDRLRQGGLTTPVLMLTALDAVDARVRGLAAGADDYLTKPFAFRELVARLHALARRRALTLAPANLALNDLEDDAGARAVPPPAVRLPRPGRAAPRARAPPRGAARAGEPGAQRPRSRRRLAGRPPRRTTDRADFQGIRAPPVSSAAPPPGRPAPR